MALLERLEMLITADGKAARSEFEQVGRAADKELGKAEDRIGRTSARLQSLGTGAAVGGALVVGGLGLLAKASDDADKQVLKLENSIKNSDQAFRNKGEALQDVAKDLQKVTAADADATIGSQSLLVQFGLTEDQILRLTPLIVDLSRKMGIDMDAAAKAVGKSVDGSAGALKKMGISVDEAAFATDSFQATFDALNQTVGGFARVEGKTFSGQLEILRNNVGDLGEAVGTGAAGVLGNLAGQAASAAGALNELNPGILTAAGGFATTAGLVATIGGGFAVAAGKAMEFRDTLTTVGKDGERSLTNVGKAASAIAVVGAVAGIITTVAEVANQVNDIDKQLATGVDRFRGALKGTDAELGRAFATLVEIEDKSAEFSGIWEGFGAEVSLGGFTADIEEADQAFNDLLDSFGAEAAQRVVNDLKAQNEQLNRNSDAYRTNARFIDQSQSKIDDRRKAQVVATVEEKRATRAQEEAIKAEERRQVTIDRIKDSVDEYGKALGSLSDEFDDNSRQAQNFATALEKTTNIDAISVAAVEVSEGFTTLKESIAALPPELDIAGVALGKYGQEAMDALTDLEKFGSVAGGFLEQLIQSGADDATVKAMGEKFRKQLVEALLAAKVPPENVPEYLGLAGLDEQQINVTLELANKQELLADLMQTLDIFQAEIDKAPILLKWQIDQAIRGGDLETAQELANAITAALSGDPVLIRAALAADPATVAPALRQVQDALNNGTLELPADMRFPAGYPSAEAWVAGIIGNVMAQKPTIDIDGNLVPAEEQVSAWLFRLLALPATPVAVTADTVAADARMFELKARIPLFGGAVPVDADTTKAEAKLKALANSFPIFGVQGSVPVDQFGIPLYGRRDGGRDGDPATPRATGGPVMAGRPYQVNELATATIGEMFVPSTPGFVMDHSESRALIEGVRQLVNGGGAPMVVNQQISTTDPVLSARESARKIRDAQYLAGV